MDGTQPQENFPAEAPTHNAGTPAIAVAGIGASISGLDGCQRLLANLPGDTGFCIVVASHGEPRDLSTVATTLRQAARMTVADAVEDTPLEPNHVYVMPAGMNLRVSTGRLKLTQPAAGAHMPIDCLLRSLATECGSRAVGVVLSGTGSDGVAGIEAIRAAGGVTFAEDVITAKSPVRAQATMITDCVDLVLSPERMADALDKLGRHSYILNNHFLQSGTRHDAAEDDFSRIMAILLGASSFDFRMYRPAVVTSRVLRRLALHNITNLAEYRKRLEDDPHELRALDRDLCTSAISFFRRCDSLEYLKRVVLPRILSKRASNQTFRVWVTGCGTGEEAFSIAILLREYMDEIRLTFPVQIFASDVNATAVDKARKARYTDNIAADLTEERLSRNFIRVNGGYEVNKYLRRMCIFARHNLVKDPPFSKLDLICCSNLSVYSNDAREFILPLFHYGLNANGHLILAEPSSGHDGLFSIVDSAHHIYAKQEVAKRPLLSCPGLGAASSFWTDGDLRGEIDAILRSRRNSAAALVNEGLEVLEIRGDAGPFLKLPAGRVSFDLLKLIPDAALFFEVERLIRRVRASGAPAQQQGIPIAKAGGADRLNLEVLPVGQKLMLVLFGPTTAPVHTGQRGEGEGDSRDRQIALLKQQLGEAREQFASGLEADRASVERIQFTTEEALSKNEELRSVNEQLEIAREELESANEELVTVNDELRVENSVLEEARNLAMSIVETVRQPLLALDMGLRIRIANRAFYTRFQASPIEVVGQLVYALGSGSWNIPGLADLLENLVNRGIPFDNFPVERDFPRVGHRSLILGGCLIEHLRMILLAIDDVTERKLAEEALRK